MTSSSRAPARPKRPRLPKPPFLNHAVASRPSR
jgi:hypothetical protein